MVSLQKQRLLWRSAFFILFLIAPIFDLLRFDLNENQLYFLGLPWGLELHSSDSAIEVVWNLTLRFLLPVIVLVSAGIYIAWKWGRLYCGWLCPHFSVVEMINALMRKATAKLSIWDKEALPEQQKDGTQVKSHPVWWLVTAFAVLFFSFLWAVALLTYLLPPEVIYRNLFNGELTQNQFNFIFVATLLLVIEFTFARHLFCRFGCAIGLFQSLAWMGNQKSMVVGFDRKRVSLCADCDTSCEHACPMRLKPRGLKRHKFTCTQCMQCITACNNVHQNSGQQPLLKMLEQHCAFDVSDRGFGHKPDIPTGCFNKDNQDKRCCEYSS